MNDLKPCPFCGGEATVRYEPSFGVYYIHCDTCGSETGNTGLYRKEDKAIEAWNTRAEKICRNDDGWCSECEHFLHDGFKWCPWCGAKVVE